MKISGFFKITLIVLFLPIAGFLIIAFHLSHSERITANTLIVEGWMPDYGLEKAYKEFSKGGYDQILLTGSKFGKGVTLYVNSYMIFYPHYDFTQRLGGSNAIIDLKLESSLGRKDSAQFAIWVNNKKLLDSSTEVNKGLFNIYTEIDIEEIDSLMIQFKNDIANEIGDRNLRVIYFEVNGQNMILENADMYVDRGRPFGGSARWNITASSFAEMAAHYFTEKGIEKNLIIPVTNEYPVKRRTYGNALSLKDYIIESDISVNGVNVVSMNYHSRRTHLTYRKVLKKGVTNVGVITSENPSLKTHPMKKYKYIFKETAALLYYSLFVLPWI